MTSLSEINVLVVDDNRQMLQLLRCMLRAGGMSRVIEVENALDALVVMRARPIDLVLLDWQMYPIDGLELTRILRRNVDSPAPFVPILMLTAHTETSRVTLARDAGVNGFIKKPISTQLLFDRVAGALTDTRMFVRSANFVGPDRRRSAKAIYAGPFRRESDQSDVIDLDDVRICA